MKCVSSKRWFYALIGVLNLAVGVMFYVVNIRPELPITTDVSFAVSRRLPVKPRVISAIVGTPVRIVIASLGIDLNVGIGSYNPADGSWTTGSTEAYYADASLPINNNNGSTLIYGHAQPQVFGRLPEIQPQAEALVYTDTGYVFHYSYESVTNVLPTDTSVFRADGPPTLILQTCTGNWDAYRAMFMFKLESDGKA